MNDSAVDSAKAGKDVIDSSIEKVEQAQAYVGILSHRCGGVSKDRSRNPDRLSITELEYRRALERGIPVYMFLMSEDYPVKPADVEANAANRKKLATLRNDAKQRSFCAEFSSVDELRSLTLQSMSELKDIIQRDQPIDPAAPAEGDGEPENGISDAPAFPERSSPEGRAVARAQRGVLAIHGVATFLNLSYPLNFQDPADHAIVDEFRAAVDALKKELITKNDQIAALAEIIAAVDDENAVLRDENQGLWDAAEKAASLGQNCREKFIFRLSEKAADAIAFGVGVGLTAGAVYLVGQWGGEIAVLFSRPVADDGPSPMPPAQQI